MVGVMCRFEVSIEIKQEVEGMRRRDGDKCLRIKVAFWRISYLYRYGSSYDEVEGHWRLRPFLNKDFSRAM